MRPTRIEIIGPELAIAWEDGDESFLHAEILRRHSPSAENQGEVDILGHRHGGTAPRPYPGVTLLGFDWVGHYAIRLRFSDGHDSGLYSWSYLRALANTHPPAG